MSETPQTHLEGQEFKATPLTGTDKIAEVDETSSWNPEFDAEIENAARQLFGEAINPFGGDPTWNEVQQSFTDADWAEARRRAGEKMRGSHVKTGVWTGEAEMWRQIELDERSAAEAREEASK